jgi:hypothetical protein
MKPVKLKNMKKSASANLPAVVLTEVETTLDK